MVEPIGIGLKTNPSIKNVPLEKQGLAEKALFGKSTFSSSSSDDESWKKFTSDSGSPGFIQSAAMAFGAGLAKRFAEMLTSKDVEAIEAAGRSVEQVAKDMAVIAFGKQYADIVEAATKANGRIGSMDIVKLPELIKLGASHVMPHLAKFVPASGAATRMFKDLNTVFANYQNLDEVNARLSEGNLPKGEAAQLNSFINFWSDIRTYPFFGELEAVMAEKGINANEKIEQGDVNTVLAFLLTPKGLNYAGKPKLALTFHLDEGIPRTAMEEHVKEAVWLSKNGRVHFTVSPFFLEQAQMMAKELTEAYAKKGISIEISFSVQDPSTDTIAMKPDGKGPFRTADGGLYFRQSGHGALLKNLNEQAKSSEFVLVQNVDNLPGGGTEILMWKMAFLGHFAKLQKSLFETVKLLAENELSEGELAKVFEIVTSEYKRPIDIKRYSEADGAGRQKILLEALDRPLVLSAMVPNKGEPGGGPFSAKDPSLGWATNQIIEGSQINKAEAGQKAVLDAATHFNPVFLLIGTRNAWGKTYDLEKFAVREGSAVFVVEKNHPQTGAPFKSLDTGLWNGCIGRTLQMFVELPVETFGPAKMVYDLNGKNRPFRQGTPYAEILPFKFPPALKVSSSFVKEMAKPKTTAADLVPQLAAYAKTFADVELKRISAEIDAFRGIVAKTKARAIK